MTHPHDKAIPERPPDDTPRPPVEYAPRILPPLPNYTLSSVCPACGEPTVRRACKVRCDRCGFMWDCSEL